MAGRAHHLAQIAHAAIDGTHNAQRQIHFIEHRALFDVNLNEAHVVGWIALDVGNFLFVQAGIFHGLAHRDAIGIRLQ